MTYTQTRTISSSALRAPPLSLLATEPLRAALDYLSGRGVGSTVHPVGDGHPVVVYPGLGGGAMTTSHLRRFLRESGFTVHDWGGGINTGPVGEFDDWLGHLVGRVRELHRLHDSKVSLIGWSLGGVYAREISKRCPDSVRQVITLATPFSALRRANHAGAVYKLMNGDNAQFTPELEASLGESPPVPTTSIFSKADGIVAWRGCLQQRGVLTENVEVSASHLGMVTHPDVLRIIVNRLCLAEDEWRPLRRAERLGRSRAQRG